MEKNRKLVDIIKELQRRRKEHDANNRKYSKT